MDNANTTYCRSSFTNYTSLHRVVNQDEFVGCLQETILHWIPPSILLLFGVFELNYYFSKRNPNRNIPFNRLNISKLISIATLIAIHLCQIVISYTTRHNHPDKNSDTSFIEQETIFATSYLVSFILLFLSLRYGVRTSPTQFMFYLASVICAAAYFQSIVQGHTLILGLYSAHFITLITLLILNCFSDQEPKILSDQIKHLENPTPQLSASFASKLFYFWATPLMWRGYKNPLEPAHLWSVDPLLTSRGCVPVFDECYESREGVDKNCYVKVSTNNEPNGKENVDAEATLPDQKNQKKSSIASPLIKAFGAEFLFGSVLHLIHIIMMMMPSQVMKMLISHVQDHGQLGENDLQSNWKGYFYGGLLLGITVFQSLLAGQYYEILFRVGMKVRSALISTIYRKSLRLANESKKDTTTGEIVNLMSIDVQRFMVIKILIIK